MTTNFSKFYASAHGEELNSALVKAFNKSIPSAKTMGKTLFLGYSTPLINAWGGMQRNWEAAANTEDLPDLEYDLIILIHALEYESNPETFLKEVWKLLVDGGKIVIVTPHNWGRFMLPSAHIWRNSKGFNQCFLYQLFKNTLFTPETNLPILKNRFIPFFAPAFVSIAKKHVFSPILTAKAKKCARYAIMPEGASNRVGEQTKT